MKNTKKRGKKSKLKRARSACWVHFVTQAMQHFGQFGHVFEDGGRL
jgi:hypothetical protein